MPPYEQLAYRAAEACGRLPLVLAVAGGILAEAGGRVTEDFIALIHEDIFSSKSVEVGSALRSTPVPALRFGGSFYR